MQAYYALERRFARLAALGHALSILSWDRSVMMPHASNPGRSDALAELEVMAHELLIDPAVGDHLADAEAAPPGDQWQAANLTEMRRAHRRATAVPADLVAALSRASARCEMTWRTARPQADFGLIEAELTEVVARTREVAQAKSEALDLTPYDALLDDFQPGLRRSAIDPIFTALRDALVPRLAKILDHQNAPLKPAGPFPADRQREIAVNLMGRLGFDFNHGRLDESAHPFCGGNPDDIRMTTRWDDDDVVTGLMAVLHETGHALYEMGLPFDWRQQPVGRSGGMALHESQSLLIEMQACRSPAFIAFLGPQLRAAFGDDPALADTNLKQVYHHVQLGLIRVDADEVTYPLHIILRYRLEQALIGGTLSVADLPEAWNAQMVELLDVSPPDDGVGCLQDIHWPAGAFGYFPSYSLGALLAAQFYDAAAAALPELDTDLRAGNVEKLVEWLRNNIHERARLVPFDQLVQDATGAPLAIDSFVRHVDRRYAAH